MSKTKVKDELEFKLPEGIKLPKLSKGADLEETIAWELAVRKLLGDDGFAQFLKTGKAALILKLRSKWAITDHIIEAVRSAGAERTLALMAKYLELPGTSMKDAYIVDLLAAESEANQKHKKIDGIFSKALENVL